jgi:Ribbon-helix-helix domain
LRASQVCAYSAFVVSQKQTTRPGFQVRGFLFHLTTYTLWVYKASMKLIRTNIWLQKDHQKQLKAISGKTGQAVSELIRRAVEEFLKKK